MAKKRKASGRAPAALLEHDERGGRPGPITTYEDVANSEDEFHINRDKVLLEEGPEAKRRRKWQENDEMLEPSDEEVLGYSSESEGDDDEDEDDHNNAPNHADVGDSDEEAVKDDEDEDIEGWGSSRKDYYGNDQIETQEDAEMEEAELQRLQQKKLQKMSEADFGFDETEWLDNSKEADEGDIVTEVLKDIEITPDMPPKERLQILQTRYPEFEFLAKELLELQPVFDTLQRDANSENGLRSHATGSPSPTIVKCRALAAYLASLTMYFAILTSPARSGETHTLNPAELQDHAIMDSLLQCRELWSKVKSLKQVTQLEASPESEIRESLPETTASGKAMIGEIKNLSLKSKREQARERAIQKAAVQRTEQIRLAEAELADLDSLKPRFRKPRKSSNNATITPDNDSDFGEEEVLDANTAAEKALKKKTLRFYTSQIAQKANKRAGAGRDAGGDMDVPYRERLRDRQARLNAEAEKRGRQLDKYGRGTALGGDSDEEGLGTANEAREDGDEYYDMFAQLSRKKKAEKKELFKAVVSAKAAGKMVRVVEGEVGDDGKRAIGRVIEKNKGLAPTRKKDVRNPRVKKRKKFEEKKKKLASVRAVYKGGEERGGYGGEKTGIRSNLVKSVKL